MATTGDGRIAVRCSPLVKRFRSILLSRWTILLVMAVAGVTVLAGLAVPQQPILSPEGFWQRAVAALGLDHIFSTWSFRVLVGVAVLQLLMVTVRLLRRDVRRLLRDRGPASRRPVVVEDKPALAAALRALRYRRVRHSASTARYVRNPWGYLGPSLLHAGMLLAMIGILAVTFTRSSGLVPMLQGETLQAGTLLEAAERGPLGEEPVLRADLTLDRLGFTYWPDGSLRVVDGVYSEVRNGVPRTLSVTTNRPRTADGTRYFQDQRVGYAFGVTLTQGESVLKKRLDLPLPASTEKPSYFDMQLPNGDLLRAKCYHDPTSSDGSPQLTLRLVRDGKVLGEHSFADATSARFGDVDVTLDFQTRWSLLVLERSQGYAVLFTSFFIIFLGAALIYGAPPREFTLTKGADGATTADWHAARFDTLFTDEEDRLRDAATAKDRVR